MCYEKGKSMQILSTNLKGIGTITLSIGLFK